MLRSSWLGCQGIQASAEFYFKSARSSTYGPARLSKNASGYGIVKLVRNYFTSKDSKGTKTFGTVVPLTLEVAELKVREVERQLPSGMGESLSKTGDELVYIDTKQAHCLSRLTLVRKELQCFRGSLLPRRHNVT